MPHLQSPTVYRIAIGDVVFRVMDVVAIEVDQQEVLSGVAQFDEATS